MKRKSAKPANAQAKPRKRRPPAPDPERNGHAAPPPADPAGQYEPILSFADIAPESQRFLWDRRIRAGAVTLLAGDQSAGKSTLAAAVAAAVTGGPGLPGGPDLGAARVLWCGGEEHASSDVRPRLRLAGARLALVKDPHQLSSGKRRRLSLPLHGSEFLKICRGEGVGLMIFDPITSYIDERLIPGSANAARRVCEMLIEIGIQTGATSLIVKHPRKGAYGSLIERVADSREWVQVPRCVLFLVAPNDRTTTRILVTKKPGPPRQPPPLRCSLAEVEGAVKIEWEGECDFDERKLGEWDDSPAERGATADAVLFLRLALDDQRQKVQDLERMAKELGLSIHQLRRAREKLGVSLYHEGGNAERVWYWQKPGGGWPQ